MSEDHGPQKDTSDTRTVKAGVLRAIQQFMDADNALRGFTLASVVAVGETWEVLYVPTNSNYTDRILFRIVTDSVSVYKKIDQFEVMD